MSKEQRIAAGPVREQPPGLRPGKFLAEESKIVLWTIVVILLVLWALGMMTSYAASGLIHILLVVALIVVVVRLFQGRRVV